MSDLNHIFKETTKACLEKLGISAELLFLDIPEKKLKVINIKPSANDSQILIGKHGQNLSALEHCVRLIAFKKITEQADQNINDINFVLDVDDYRKFRAEEIVSLAKTTAERVSNTRRAEALPPMTSYERRIVHVELAGFSDLHTESIGQEPRRRIVIKPDSALFL